MCRIHLSVFGAKLDYLDNQSRGVAERQKVASVFATPWIITSANSVWLKSLKAVQVSVGGDNLQQDFVHMHGTRKKSHLSTYLVHVCIG